MIPLLLIKLVILEKLLKYQLSCFPKWKRVMTLSCSDFDFAVRFLGLLGLDRADLHRSLNHLERLEHGPADEATQGSIFESAENVPVDVDVA